MPELLQPWPIGELLKEDEAPVIGEAEHPGEFLGRASQIVELRLDRLLRNLPLYETLDWEEAMADLGRHLGREVGTSAGLREIGEEVGERLAHVRSGDPSSLV